MLNKYLAAPDKYGKLKEWARQNRANQTEGELVLWKHIRGNELGVKFLRQFIIEDYIADFVCRETGLVIEVDGGYHCQEEQMIFDNIRTLRLEELGFKVIRFTNDEILMNTQLVLEEIKRNINL